MDIISRLPQDTTCYGISLPFPRDEPEWRCLFPWRLFSPICDLHIFIFLRIYARRNSDPFQPVALRSRLPFLSSGTERLCRSEEHTSELQSLMRKSYAVFCLTKKRINVHNYY